MWPPTCSSNIMIRMDGWIQGPVVSYHGIQIMFRANRPGVLAAIDSTFIPGCCAAETVKSDLTYSLESDESRGTYAAYIGSRRLIQASNLDRVVDFVRSHARHAIAENSLERLFVHAGAVGWRGKAILLPGKSHAGKSLLVRELICAGALYFSDEFAVLDSDGFVHPFALPLSVRTLNGKVACHANELGANTAVEPLPVGLLLFTKYKAGATFQPARLTEGRAVLELLKHIVAVRNCPRTAVRIAKSVISGCEVLHSIRGEARSITQALLV